MTGIPINLATEDELSEAVLRKLLRHVRRGYYVGTAYRRGGFGYLRKTVVGCNRAACGIPFIILTDLDRHACPRGLIDSWLPEQQHHNLLFRIAVREVELGYWLIEEASPDF